MLPATSTLGDEVAVSGQSSLAAIGPILLSAHTPPRLRHSPPGELGAELGLLPPIADSPQSRSLKFAS